MLEKDEVYQKLMKERNVTIDSKDSKNKVNASDEMGIIEFSDEILRPSDQFFGEERHSIWTD
jgi:hypothetical protein